MVKGEKNDDRAREGERKEAKRRDERGKEASD